MEDFQLFGLICMLPGFMALVYIVYIERRNTTKRKLTTVLFRIRNKLVEHRDIVANSNTIHVKYGYCFILTELNINIVKQRYILSLLKSIIQENSDNIEEQYPKITCGKDLKYIPVWYLLIRDQFLISSTPFEELKDCRIQWYDARIYVIDLLINKNNNGK